MTGVGDDSRGRPWGRPWLVVGLTLAVGATLALVLSDDLRWLRLGIVAALWAALIGAFLAVKYRKHAATSEDAVAEAQAVYELELEREVAARREFELEVEAETRQRAEEDSREELDALRNEVLALRDSLQSLFGGEVLYERVALTAQATRMRSLNDDKRIMNGEPKKQPAQLMAPKKIVEVAERPTELIERVLDQAVEQRRQPARPKPETPTTSRTAAKQTEPVRRDPAHPQSSPAAKATQAIKVVQATPRKAAANEPPKTERQLPPVKKPTLKPAPRPSETSPGFKPVKPGEPARAAFKPPAEPPRPAPKPAPEPTRPALDRVERGRPAASVPLPKPDPVAPKMPERPAAASNQEATGEWKPAVDTGRRERTATNLSAAFVKREKPPVEEPPRKPEPVKVEINPTLPEAARDLQQSRPGGRRRRAEEEEAAAAATPEPVSTGRRHRPDGEPPAWQKPAPEPASRHGATNGSHSRPENRNGSNGTNGSNGSHGTNGSNGSNGSNGNGHRTAAAHGKEIPDAGSHAAGRSVSELLAAHGSSDSAPRRRRRAED